MLEDMAGYMSLKAFPQSLPVKGEHLDVQEWSDEAAITHVEEVLQIENESIC